ncbi:MAG: GNAT family N-acetyltransferase [Myxococcota bacterium]|nr:GNAT family N-acetyltransferase [Myxococcota bacterium]
MTNFQIRKARQNDCGVILHFIRSLAAYENLSHEVIATEEALQRSLFGEKAFAEVILGFEDDKPVGFALFFHNYSTFLAQPGLYLEDLFVEPDSRGRGYGKALLKELARYAVERNCGRLEWSVLDWNQPAIDFYLSLRAAPMSDWTTFRLTGEDLRRLSIS